MLCTSCQPGMLFLCWQAKHWLTQRTLWTGNLQIHRNNYRPGYNCHGRCSFSESQSSRYFRTEKQRRFVRSDHDQVRGMLWCAIAFTTLMNGEAQVYGHTLNYSTLLIVPEWWMARGQRFQNSHTMNGSPRGSLSIENRQDVIHELRWRDLDRRLVSRK